MLHVVPALDDTVLHLYAVALVSVYIQLSCWMYRTG
jgi:hypothetical protein